MVVVDMVEKVKKEDDFLQNFGQKLFNYCIKVELDEIVHCSSSVAAATSLHLCTATTTTGTERNAGE